mmetsp:Transcript_15525/g.27577  ORF Transcript_15525/g.27577 Transcript_15525/m.27577 type:complete len:513 (+) Transcript_15525:561-2099(+)|eukprot:CAMPEP_0205946676 /NCGR_PEP_ID=MMETSP1325-20131115/69165_1 /ASSEMBLY_ACC=CAM_ASM_000708 /TAXON_ID=236786 /ORGANISM="Florenciella sp., Strain RCC1007" /LENGTH=512 /DNA_ID=CAMNT_0053317765 /DNA_START=874 /DNA_END=2412 /DNA_ORIENTATION=-
MNFTSKAAGTYTNVKLSRFLLVVGFLSSTCLSSHCAIAVAPHERAVVVEEPASFVVNNPFMRCEPTAEYSQFLSLLRGYTAHYLKLPPSWSRRSSRLGLALVTAPFPEAVLCTTTSNATTIAVHGYNTGWYNQTRPGIDEKCKIESQRRVSSIITASPSPPSSKNAITPQRHVLFTTGGFLEGRPTWGATRDPLIGSHVMVVSICAQARLYRPNVDISVPATPYPKLLEQRCDGRARIFESARANTDSVDDISMLLDSKLDFFFLGTPTHHVRKAMRAVPPVKYRDAKVRANITVMAGGEKVHRSNHPWGETGSRNKCGTLVDSALSHHRLLQQSLFGLVPRGHGVYSYRLTEVMLAGAVPVILSNGWVLPFSEFLEYDSFAIRLDEHTFGRDPPKELASLLDDISPDCITAMRRRARHVALTHFSTSLGRVRGLAMVIAARARGCGQPARMAMLPTTRVPVGEDGGSVSRERNMGVRGDVARGGSAAVCLPPHRQQAALPARVLQQEVGEP